MNDEEFPQRLADAHRIRLNRIFFYHKCEECNGELTDSVCLACDPDLEPHTIRLARLVTSDT